IYNADLHIHGPHSIAVSKTMNLDTIVATCRHKGLNIVGTGDILQPDWQKYMENNLKRENHGLVYKNIYFILQTEIEDSESIHHVVFFPNFNCVKEIQDKLKAHSKNMLNEWGGRPRVNLTPPELVDILDEHGAIIGPAHAFTPFKAIFRQDRYETLEKCYQDSTKKVFFLELGLSANTDLADRLECLKDVSFLSNSDAHSEHPRSLGREFNQFEIVHPSFEEIELALRRKNGRRIKLNVGLHPKLGKYYNMFCSKCRRRVLFKKNITSTPLPFSNYQITHDFITYFSENPGKSRVEYINQVSRNKVICPACKEQLGKAYKIRLGVSERIEIISSTKTPQHPPHRPPYINAIPLIDIIRAVKGIKSASSKTIEKIYDEIIKKFGSEFHVLIDLDIQEIQKYNEKIALIINALRKDEIEYLPGGGGTYGEIKIDI
ncbi:MAG: endonuclease Q family protein, partial [Promethearchaeota archaeon]